MSEDMPLIYPNDPQFERMMREGRIVSGADSNTAEQAVAGKPKVEPREPTKQSKA